MPSDKLPHLFIPHDRVDRRDYTYPRAVPGPRVTLPAKQPGVHGAKLLADLARIGRTTGTVQAARTAVGLPDDQGMLLEFEIEPGFDLALDKLDRPYTGSIKYLGAFTITPKDAA